MACVSVVEHGTFPVKTGTGEKSRGLKGGRGGGEEGGREIQVRRVRSGSRYFCGMGGGGEVGKGNEDGRRPVELTCRSK